MLKKLFNGAYFSRKEKASHVEDFKNLPASEKQIHTKMKGEKCPHCKGVAAPKLKKRKPFKLDVLRKKPGKSKFLKNFKMIKGTLDAENRSI